MTWRIFLYTSYTENLLSIVKKALCKKNADEDAMCSSVK